MQLNSLTTGLCVCVVLLLTLHSIPVAVDTSVMDTLEEASAALQSRILAVHADQDLSHALLLVVRMVVPGYSYVSPL